MQMKHRTSTLPVTSTVVRAVTAMFAGSELHAKQMESVAHAIIGAMAAPDAGVAALGRSAAAIRCKDAKHGIKQLDRLLSNRKIDDLDLVRQQVTGLVRDRDIEAHRRAAACHPGDAEDLAARVGPRDERILVGNAGRSQRIGLVRGAIEGDIAVCRFDLQ
jgi:hypothetical protein